MQVVEREEWERGLFEELERIPAQPLADAHAAAASLLREVSQAPETELAHALARMPEVDYESWCPRLA